MHIKVRKIAEQARAYRVRGVKERKGISQSKKIKHSGKQRQQKKKDRGIKYIRSSNVECSSVHVSFSSSFSSAFFFLAGLLGAAESAEESDVVEFEEDEVVVESTEAESILRSG